jgi:hypothetical protein
LRGVQERLEGALGDGTALEGVVVLIDGTELAAKAFTGALVQNESGTLGIRRPGRAVEPLALVLVHCSVGVAPPSPLGAHGRGSSDLTVPLAVLCCIIA